MNILKQILNLEIAAVYYLLLCSYVFARGRRIRHVDCESTGTSIDVASESGVKIEPHPYSKVNFHSLSEHFDDGHLIIFDFKTTADSATIFYTTRRNDEYDMVSASIVNGHVHFKIRCKSSFADLTIPKIKVNDNKWHKIYFRRRNKKGIFKLDGLEYFRPFQVGCGGFTSVNFGNINIDDLSSYSVQELQETDGPFDGCIRNVIITTEYDAPPIYSAVSTCS